VPFPKNPKGIAIIISRYHPVIIPIIVITAARI
jgi:hypothetical protein